MPETTSIDIRSIPATINYISKITNIPFSYLKDHTLGSVGRSKKSNDIDLAIDSNKFIVDKVYSDLKRALGHDNVDISKDLTTITAIVPIEGNPDNGFAKVDLMFTHDMKWSKFNFFSAGDSSKYHGIMRNKLLSAIIAASNHEEMEDDVIIRKKGWVWIPSKGIEYQISERSLDDSGKRAKEFKVIYHGEMENDPNTVAKLLFPNDKSVIPEKLGSVEDIMELVKTHKSPKEQQKIMKILRGDE